MLQGLHSAPSIDMAFMAVVFLIGILGQPFELFNRAPIPLVEGRKRNMFVFACVFVLLGVFYDAELFIVFALAFSPA